MGLSIKYESRGFLRVVSKICKAISLGNKSIKCVYISEIDMRGCMQGAIFCCGPPTRVSIVYTPGVSPWMRK